MVVKAAVNMSHMRAPCTFTAEGDKKQSVGNFILYFVCHNTDNVNTRDFFSMTFRALQFHVASYCNTLNGQTASYTCLSLTCISSHHRVNIQHSSNSIKVLTFSTRVRTTGHLPRMRGVSINSCPAKSSGKSSEAK